MSYQVSAQAQTEGKQARVLDALGDPTRRAVLEVLREGAQPVGRIAGRLPVSRPAVSQHLRVLKEAGLVWDRRDGTRRLYSVDTAGLSDLRAYLERYWDTALAAFKEAAESAGGKGGTR
jgi:DNA-binding transcriptional ArsR family regulator